MGEPKWQGYALWSTLGDMALAVPTLAFFAFVVATRALAWWGYGLVALFMLGSAWFFSMALVRALSGYAWNDETFLARRWAASEHHYDWSQLNRLDLRHFGTRRKHAASTGRAELYLSFAGEGGALRRLTIDSNLLDFPLLVARAEWAAKKNRLDLDEAVWEGLAVLAGEAELSGEETGRQETKEKD